MTEDELTADLAALPNVLDPARPVTGFREPSSPAQMVVSRFFFIHQAQAVRDDRRLTTVEFLHATFGEYLVSRLVVRELIDLGVVSAVVTSRVRAPASDGFLRALLSFAPLTTRSQVVEFLTAQISRTAPRDISGIRNLLLDAFRNALEPPQSRSHEDYRPARMNVPGLHAAYSANLVLLIILVGGQVTGRELFPHAPFSVKEWREHVMLWRSQFSGEGWRSLAAALHLKRVWVGDERDITLSAKAWPEPELLNGFWTFRIPLGDDLRRRWSGWRTVRADDLRHESFITCDLAEDVAWHAPEPVIRDLDVRVLQDEPDEVEATTAFGQLDDDTAVSVTHALMRLWLVSSETSSSEELERVYEDCVHVIGRSRPEGDDQSRNSYYVRVIRQLAADRDRLSLEVRKRIYAQFANSATFDRYLDSNEQALSWVLGALADDGLDRGTSP